ncbi:unnamed protein product, partial [Meganyctiphanes norvegica]
MGTCNPVFTDIELDDQNQKENGTKSNNCDLRDGKHNVGRSSEVIVDDDNSGGSGVIYKLDDVPPWYTCMLLGLQHYLLMVESTVSIPYLLTPLMCMASNDPDRGNIASTIIFVSGLVTLLQTIFGIRLPIVQGGTHGFLGPILSILTLMPCPGEEQLEALDEDSRREIWQERMRAVQGAVCVAAILQVMVGGTGAIGVLLKWITPLVITPTVTLIGLSLFPVAASKASSHWGIAALTIILLIVFTQYLSNVAVPFPHYSKTKGFFLNRIYLFKLFPVILAVGLSWGFCWILTVNGALPEGSAARTDLRKELIINAPWFRVPYPGQWGLPTVTVAGVLGVMAGVLASIVESVGDYFACARLAGAPAPPRHAVNRGIWIEGLGTIMAGLWGTASGTTSYSQNVGAIGITKVASRRVIQYAAMIMLFCGLIGKVGALFIMIPEPIIGGIFCVVFAMITAVGLSNLQYIDLNSTRNLFILGFSLFFSLAMPVWMQKKENTNLIQTNWTVLDQVLTVLLRTSMFIGGMLGLILDNTIPGTPEERGIIKWQALIKPTKKEQEDGSRINIDQSSYDLPFVMDLLRRYTDQWLSLFPPSLISWWFKINTNPD